MAFRKSARGLRNGLWLGNRYRPHKGHCCLPQDVLQAYRGEFGAFVFIRDAARKKSLYRIKEKLLGAWEALLKRGRSYGVREWTIAKVMTVHLTKVTFVRRTKVWQSRRKQTLVDPVLINIHHSYLL